MGGNWWAWEFLVYPDEGEPKAERELDLAWVKDGLFGIAGVPNIQRIGSEA